MDSVYDVYRLPQRAQFEPVINTRIIKGFGVYDVYHLPQRARFEPPLMTDHPGHKYVGL